MWKRLTGIVEWVRYWVGVVDRDPVLAFVDERIGESVVDSTDSTDVIFTRLIQWFRAHPPSEDLMAQLSLLQAKTERHGNSESYRIVTVYAAAMESFTDHHP